MAYVTAKALKDGPYEVSGGAKILNHTGKESVAAPSTRFICAAAARRRTNPSAMAATKTSASKRKR